MSCGSCSQDQKVSIGDTGQLAAGQWHGDEPEEDPVECFARETFPDSGNSRKPEGKPARPEQKS